ncbi:hypothetical protein [Bradyrhizobium huanghuaihaiense]|uniref:COG3904 family protein n=1 Tax=Bradyrhizobium huanghuaihaiense TaxID=990078 RepID=UPI003CC531C0
MFVIPVYLLAVSLLINLATISKVDTSERIRISNRASDHSRWAETRGWMLLVGAFLCIALMAVLSGSVHAGVALEERKLPMKFTWVDCQPNCRGWVRAAGIVTADSPTDFDEFAHGRQLGGATIVLDSSGGSVNASIALGRRFRELGALTTVGVSVQTNTAQGAPANIAPVAYCESMCVFLLLSGKTRYVPETAHVRVHQIWLGDRANDAKAATYSADDLMIVERDIGRLAKYTFDMGGAGDLLSLSLNVPPWEDLHELSRDELRLTNLVTTDKVARAGSPDAAMVELMPKPLQGRIVSSAVATSPEPNPIKSADAMSRMGGGQAAMTPLGQTSR